jgi:hypothetical protein
MTFGASNVVAPMLAATEVVMFLSTGMTTKTRLGDFFLRLVFEGNDLRRITIFHMCAAWAMA